MTSDEERLKRRKRRNHLAKELEEAKYRQRKVDKKYKKLKAILQETAFDEANDDLHSN